MFWKPFIYLEFKSFKIIIIINPISSFLFSCSMDVQIVQRDWNLQGPAYIHISVIRNVLRNIIFLCSPIREDESIKIDFRTRLPTPNWTLKMLNFPAVQITFCFFEKIVVGNDFIHWLTEHICSLHSSTSWLVKFTS